MDIPAEVLQNQLVQKTNLHLLHQQYTRGDYSMIAENIIFLRQATFSIS